MGIFRISDQIIIPNEWPYGYADAKIAKSYKAKSVILDVADRWDIVFGYMQVRSVEFFYNNVPIELVSNFTAYASSSYNASFVAANAFNTSLSQIGTYTGNEWLTSSISNQRLIVVFDDVIRFDSIIINNGHDSGEVKGGIKNTKIHISTDAITRTVYGDAIANSTLIFDGQIAAHVAANTVDDQVLELL